LIEDLATQKCLDVVRRSDKNSLVFAADTVVVLHNKILGKPHSKEEAFKMLKSLSCQTHSVVTSICAINTKTNRAVTLSNTSYVRFKTLSDEIITDYIDKFSPLDKAGSYGIQELPDGILDKYEGSFENIVGLSPEATMAVLEKLEYKQ
jgi:septum formation protein